MIITIGERIFAYGTLEKSDDLWTLHTREQSILLDLALCNTPRENEAVSVIGLMEVAAKVPGVLTLVVERLATHDDIALAAYQIYQSTAHGSTDDNWYRAERTLLGISYADVNEAATSEQSTKRIAVPV